MVESIHVHLVATKHVMRYLKGTLDYGIKYVVKSEFRLCGYTDLDWEGSAKHRKSTLGCCFSLGSDVISWIIRNQISVSLVYLSLSTLQHVHPIEKQYGFTNYWKDISIPRWMQHRFIVTTRVASS